MRSFKLVLAYDGGNYAGWQIQHNQPTIQAAVQTALARITGRPLRVVGSGRTDAGVHALGQVVSFESPTELSATTLRNALNAELPSDIAALSLEETATGFHARIDATAKRYRYWLVDGFVPDVFRLKYAWHVRDRLDCAVMYRAAQALVGTHDFRSYATRWPPSAGSVRTIYEIQLQRGTGIEANLISLEIEGSGFLYNMVRTIVGTLVEVGRGAKDESWPAAVLEGTDRRLAGMTAPAHGLYLVSVHYDDRAAGSTSNEPGT